MGKNLKELLKKMTTEEKIGQLTQLASRYFIKADGDITAPVTELGMPKEKLPIIGSVLGCRTPERMRTIQDWHLKNDRNKIPIVFMKDVIHGYRTVYPIPLAMGCSFDIELMKECCRMAAKEASAGGNQVVFAPMVDYVRDARWGRVMETCGEDPLINSLMGAAQVEALRGEDIKDKENVATCVKHFAAYGGAEAGRDYTPVELSEHALREFYLPAYKVCIDAGSDMIMTSFNTLNGVPSTANTWLIQDILKKEWGFDGLIISDHSAVEELITHGVAENLKEAAKMAFANSCDIEMGTCAYYGYLEELINEGVFSMEQLDNAVMRILEFKDRLGLFDDPYHGAVQNSDDEIFLSEDNRKIARKAAEESAVLLKNDNILPLSKKIKKIALIGPYADNKAIIGEWAGSGKIEESVSIREGIERLLPNAEIVVKEGCGNLFDDFDDSGFNEAVEAAKSADVAILCIGEPSHYSGEGNCRTNIDLTGVQNQLAEAVYKANRNTVAVTFSGRPLDLTKLSAAVPAILHMWFPGTEGGNAVANLLFGIANPSGKLTMSFPKATGQCPIYYNHTNTGRPITKEQEDIHVKFYSNYLDCGNRPLYPFGYGLSYSNFVYKSLELSSDKMTKDSSIEVSITVTNDSDVCGNETVLLFMRDITASNARPVQQLIDFKKVYFKANETKTVKLTINEPMLRFWNNNNEYVSEAGNFEISTGFADNLVLTKFFKLVKML